jgi:hypothetical protein
MLHVLISITPCSRNLLQKLLVAQLVKKFPVFYGAQRFTADIVTEIKVRGLEWLGHIIRMDGARMAKKVFVSKREGRRDIGRPKLRWLDDVEDDIKALGIRRWRIKAQDKNE